MSHQEGVIKIHVRKDELCRIAKASPYTKSLLLAVEQRDDDDAEPIVIEFDQPVRTEVASHMNLCETSAVPVMPPYEISMASSFSANPKKPKPISVFDTFTKGRIPPPSKSIQKSVSVKKPMLEKLDTTRSSFNKSGGLNSKEEESGQKRFEARAILEHVFSDLKNAFKELDMDGDGNVSLQEMKIYFNHHKDLYPNISDDLLEDWFSALDIDGDGNLTMEEMMEAIEVLDEEGGEDDLVFTDVKEYWDHYQKVKIPQQYHIPAWSFDKSNFADEIKREMAETKKHEDTKKQMHVDRQLLRRTVERQIRNHDIVKFQNDLMSHANNIDNELFSMADCRKILQDVVGDMQSVVDPSKKKSSEEKARALKAEQRRKNAKNRQKTMSEMGLTGKFKASKDLLAQEFAMQYTDVQVAPSVLECRRLAAEHKIDLSEVETLKEIFDKFDVDGGGVIDLQEMAEMATFMRQNGPLGVDAARVTAQEVENEMTMADKDHDKGMSFDEFVGYVSKIRTENADFKAGKRLDRGHRRSSAALLYDDRVVHKVKTNLKFREALFSAKVDSEDSYSDDFD